jgi:hypothetical protein
MTGRSESFVLPVSKKKQQAKFSILQKYFSGPHSGWLFLSIKVTTLAPAGRFAVAQIATMHAGNVRREAE